VSPPQLWLVYSVLVVIVGVVLLLLTGRAGIILIIGGVIGVFNSVARSRRS
jgi:hypothetical protein